MRNSVLFVLVLIAGQIAAQAQEKKAAPQILFTVKKNPVYTDEFIYLYKKNHLSAEDFTEKKINEYLDLFINFKLKVAEARLRGLDTTAAFVKEFKSYKEELKKPFLAEKNELERLTLEVYSRLGEEVKASHILIGVKPDAFPADTLAAYNKILDLRKRILEGEDFEKIAKQISEDPSARTNGGNLGYFTAMQMVYQFEQAAYTLKPGEVSNPVRTRFGYHLVKLYDRKPARGEVEVSHIILRTGAGGDDKKVKNKIFEIYDQVKAGRKWDELVKEYSEDQATKDSGGKLRPFGVGAMAGVPEFESAAFSLKNTGDFSDPFQSAYGWHVIRLERKIPLPPYTDVQDALRKRVARDERLQIADKKRLEQTKKQLGLQEFEDVKKFVVSGGDTTLQKGKWRFKGDPSLKAKTIFKIQNQDVSAGSFISYVEKNQTQNGVIPSAYMISLYDAYLLEQLTEIEDEKLIKENSDFRNLLTEYKEGILLFTIMEKEVWNRGAEDTVALRKFYNDNKSKYKAGERVHARILATTDKALLESVKAKIEKGDSISTTDLKKFKSIVPFRNYERGDNKAIDKISWAVGLHETDSDALFYLIEIDKLVPSGDKTFQEARPQLVADRQDVIEKAWVTELRKKYPVKVNNKGKKIVLNELIRK